MLKSKNCRAGAGSRLQTLGKPDGLLSGRKESNITLDLSYAFNDDANTLHFTISFSSGKEHRVLTLVLIIIAKKTLREKERSEQSAYDERMSHTQNLCSGTPC